MKQQHHDFGNSPGKFLSNLSAKIIAFLIITLMLAYGCGGGLIAIASQKSTAHTDHINEPSGSQLPFSNTEILRQAEKQAQNHKDKTTDKEQTSESQFSDPFATLKLAVEGNPLGGKLTRESATEAIKKYRTAFEVFKSQGNKLGMAATLFACGTVYYFLGQMREALSELLQASEYSKASGLDALLRPLLDASIGSVYTSLGETGKALEMLERTLPTMRRLNNIPMLAQMCANIGQLYVGIGQKRKALEYLNEARNLYQKTENWQMEIIILTLISAVSSSLGQSTNAFETAHAAVNRAKEKKDQVWEAQGHLALGAAYASISNMASAIAEYKQAAQAMQTETDKSGEAMILNNLGLIYMKQGDFDLALDYFKRALKLCEGNNKTVVMGYTLNNMGTIYEWRGDRVKALQHYEKALALSRQYDDERLKATVLSNMAEASLAGNNLEYVLKLFKENAAIFRKIEEPFQEALTLANVASAYGLMNRYQEALDVLRQALESKRWANDPGPEGYILREMGYKYSIIGDHSNALKYYEASLSKLEAAKDVSGQTDLYTIIGSVYIRNHDYLKAEELLYKGLTMAQTAKLPQSEMIILAAFGFLHDQQGNLVQAENFYNQASAISESIRASARIEELKTEVSDRYSPLLVPAILLKGKLSKWSEAFELVERARARTFLDQLNSVRIDIHKGANPELTDQEQALRFDMRLLEEKLKQEQRNNLSSEAAKVMAASLKEKEDAYTSLLIRLKASNPDYAELQSYQPKPLNEIQQLLGSQTTLISYFVTAEKTLAFVVSSDSFQAVEIPVKQTELLTAISWFRSFANLREPLPQSLTQLHAWLIAPIRQYIKTSDVVIVPHGILHYVPFAALTDGQHYFGDEHRIYHLPNASTLALLRRRNSSDGKRLLSVAQAQAPGFPLLHYADAEASNVAKLYKTRPLLTGRATIAEFRKQASVCDILHIAAHAELNAGSPLFSRILLAPDKDDSGAIEVREVYGMDLTGTNLVVLSACQTQLGAQSKGDDIVGLNRAFLYAGTSSVIASLWRVDDQATNLLMKTFYSYLKQGMSKAAALQAAQIATRKKYPNPYYWAAFVLTGEPGKTKADQLANK
jgi:CHAT domain-containing protein/Tfp pilus assembly protein PilF